jgi:SWI/SNF-related matrix-associated actin-dependent regulator 1 of chromatin subfamily A
MSETLSEKMNLPMPLRAFQEVGVRAAWKFGGRVLIADEMGLGKTPQAIVAAFGYNEWPVIVVCPASLRYNWKREWMSWCPTLFESDICVLEKKKQAIGGKVIITSYEIASALSIELASLSPACVILDESHYIKNHKAQRTKRLTPLCKNARRVFLLTGTPILNRPVELWSQLMALGLTDFGDLFKFGRRYCRLHRGRFGWDFSGSSNLLELNSRLLQSCMVRRRKDEVLKELPPKQRVRVVVEPVHRPSPESIRSECENALRRSKGDVHKARSLLRKERVRLSGILFKEYSLLGQHKAPLAAEWAAENSSLERPLVLFGHHKVMLNTCCELLSGLGISWIRIDGDTPSARRMEYVDKFQSGGAQVAVLSLTAASTGLTFTAAADMLIAELPFGPGLAAQAEDRIHRIGQQNSALIRYMIAERSLDENLWGIINRKSAIASAAIDGVEVSRFSGSEEEISLGAGIWEVIDEVLSSLSQRQLSLI